MAARQLYLRFIQIKQFSVCLSIYLSHSNLILLKSWSVFIDGRGENPHDTAQDTSCSLRTLYSWLGWSAFAAAVPAAVAPAVWFAVDLAHLYQRAMQEQLLSAALFLP